MHHVACGGPVSGRSNHENDVERPSPIVAPQAIKVAHCLQAWRTQQQDSSPTSPLADENSGTLQASRLRSDSNERVPLTQPWHFPPNVKYYKSTLGSLHGYTQAAFEKEVTEGYIVEDFAGFCFNANGKYLLLHEPDIRQNRGKALDNGEYLENQALSPQNLFPTPKSVRRAALRRRPTTLPPSSPSPPRTPLATPWIFSPNGLYKEAFCAATAKRSELDIERDVSDGRLIVDKNGIRLPDTRGYILYYTGERDNSEKLYTPRITRLEKPGTPLVETSEIDAWAGSTAKTIRINKHCKHVAPTAIVSKGFVVDNERKSTSLHDRDDDGLRLKSSTRS
ncbi:hypothetical protein BDU57DRAFT_510541 [Ampelomyces quisqualis]|uniref:Uncharacterized protein n=1 Tax=Ampelomyces quisqualis TaxID=50730 RepID=A0A6A5R3N7_AMPQU|nr:hypothetical protein BDU57DRAFT_510541 [Ampelomyces quisqualis]